MKKKNQAQSIAWQQRLNEHAHYVIDGKPYSSISAVFRAACKRGYTGGLPAIRRRLTGGDKTWERLLRPIDQEKSSSRRSECKKNRDEMADVIAALDARKKEMGL